MFAMFFEVDERRRVRCELRLMCFSLLVVG